LPISRDRLGRWGRTVSARRRERRRRRTPEQDGVHSSPVGLRVVHVDAFTDTPFRGNPAAVCVLPAPRDERWMQDVAREMNLSETAFLHGAPDGWSLRWFTPTVEVALCGHAALAKLPVRGVIVTSRASDPYDFASRFFAPGSGIAEDPVTGSSHCALGPFWSARLGKSELLAYQASARGGVVRVRVVGDRVKLGGQAVTVLRADLL